MKLLQTTAIILCLILACHISAQSVNQDLTGSVLWKVSGNGLGKPSYIFGTHHLISKSFLDSIPGLDDAFKSTSGVVGELVLTDIESKGALMMQATMMPTGESYKNLLSEEDYQFLDTELKKIFGGGLEQMGMFRPVAISNFYVISTYQKRHPESTAAKEPIDLHFQKLAIEQGKSISGLETVEEQINVIFLGQSISEQVNELLCMLKNPEYTDESLEQLEKFYRKGDLDSLTGLIEDKDGPCPSDEKFQNAVLTDRNNKWIEKLPSIMQESPSFIAVGSGHLGGNTGILSQLREKGYTVEAIK